jgi:hypothetical protein
MIRVGVPFRLTAHNGTPNNQTGPFAYGRFIVLKYRKGIANMGRIQTSQYWVHQTAMDWLHMFLHLTNPALD